MGKTIFVDDNIQVDSFNGGVIRGQCFQLTVNSGMDFTTYSEAEFVLMLEELLKRAKGEVTNP